MSHLTKMEKIQQLRKVKNISLAMSFPFARLIELVANMSEEIICKHYCMVTKVPKFISKHPELKYDGPSVRCLVYNRNLLISTPTYCQ